MGFTRRIDTDLPYDQAVTAIKVALQAQGFGTLTEIDLRQTLKDKLDVDTDPSVIIGACNPQLAHRALGIDPRVATLLPCNVVVRTEDGRTVVEALDPAMMADVSGVTELREVAEDAARRIQLALDPRGGFVMAGVIACPSCGKKNRVPASATGSPVCPACKTSLPWLVEATHDNLDAVLDANVPVVVDLWAPWCGPCRMIAPILEQLAAARAGRLKIVKVNVDELPFVSARYGVQGIPTLLLLRGGREVARQVGAAPQHALEQWLDAHVGGGS